METPSALTTFPPVECLCIHEASTFRIKEQGYRVNTILKVSLSRVITAENTLCHSSGWRSIDAMTAMIPLNKKTDIST